MKKLMPHQFDQTNCRAQWNEFQQLLKSKGVLDENKDILPFFKARNDLSTFVSLAVPFLSNADVIAHEYTIYGDFRADLIVGDSRAHHYLLVEFENGSTDSIFKRKAKKATPDWAPRFEGAFSQLVDWLWKLDDMRSTGDFAHAFGDRQAKFQGLIVIGKDMQLDAQSEARLKWRANRVVVDSNSVSCMSFDDLASDMDFRLTNYYRV
jgi:hypothetical protein